MGAPEVFRKPDGSYGLVATVNGASTQVYLYDSADLVTWTGERVVTVSTVPATRVHVEHDNGLPGYVLTFTGADGRTSRVTSTDLTTFSAPVEVTGVVAAAAGTLPDGTVGSGAVQTASLALTADEVERVTARYGRVVATGVSALASSTAAGPPPPWACSGTPTTSPRWTPAPPAPTWSTAPSPAPSTTTRWSNGAPIPTSPSATTAGTGSPPPTR
jgi:hypothetical protein